MRVRNDNLLNHNVWISALIGLLTGLVSSGLLQALLMGDVDIGNERFDLQAHLALSAGVAFAAIAPPFLGWRFGLPVRALIGCAAASIGGMFLATETAFWTYIWIDETAEPNFVLPYLAGSVVGAAILSSTLAWATGRGHAKPIVIQGVLWPTLWATAMGMYMSMDRTADPLEWPVDMLLFCGWQAAFLSALARTLPRPEGQNASKS